MSFEAATAPAPPAPAAPRRTASQKRAAARAASKVDAGAAAARPGSPRAALGSPRAAPGSPRAAPASPRAPPPPRAAGVAAAQAPPSQPGSPCGGASGDAAGSPAAPGSPTAPPAPRAAAPSPAPGAGGPPPPSRLAPLFGPLAPAPLPRERLPDPGAAARGLGPDALALLGAWAALFEPCPEAQQVAALEASYDEAASFDDNFVAVWGRDQVDVQFYAKRRAVAGVAVEIEKAEVLPGGGGGGGGGGGPLAWLSPRRGRGAGGGDTYVLRIISRITFRLPRLVRGPLTSLFLPPAVSVWATDLLTIRAADHRVLHHRQRLHNLPVAPWLMRAAFGVGSSLVMQHGLGCCAHAGRRRDAGSGRRDADAGAAAVTSARSSPGVAAAGRRAALLAGAALAGAAAPRAARAGLVQFPAAELKNNYVLVRAGESESEAEDAVLTNPVWKQSGAASLSKRGKAQVVREALPALRSLGVCGDAGCWIWPSITNTAYQTGEILAYALGVGRSRIVPEYSFLDARGVGALDGGRVAETYRRLAEGDALDAGWRPPPGYDGTPNESAADVLTRMRQVMSITETQYSGEDVVFISPDSDTLSVLQAAVVGLDVRRHRELAFRPGEPAQPAQPPSAPHEVVVRPRGGDSMAKTKHGGVAGGKPGGTEANGEPTVAEASAGASPGGAANGKPAEASERASLAATSYGTTTKRFINTVNDLRANGAHFTLDLPTLVVCGNQSAGKSSVLERLAGVKLPRAAGTCTRCPTEVRLSTGGEWHCDIKLRREVGKDNVTPLADASEVPFAAVPAARKRLLHLYVSAAQRALLNPKDEPGRFKQQAAAAAKAANGGAAADGGATADGEAGSGGGAAGSGGGAADSGSTKDELAFTPNVVVLTIAGAEADLTLIDLPGIIHTSTREEGEDEVRLVQDLVKSYVERRRAIIVMTVSAKDDVQNQPRAAARHAVAAAQQIVSLAKKADPTGSRTIGVVTKVDTLEQGTHSAWRDVMANEGAFRLALGYYWLRNPPQAELDKNVTLEEAVSEETKFFRTDLYFSVSMPDAMAGRCGVGALRNALSDVLVSLIQAELPGMRVAAEEKLEQVNKDIAALPPPPSSDRSTELLMRLQRLAKAMAAAVEGHDDNHFRQATARHFADFKAAVLKARPKFELPNNGRQQQEQKQPPTEEDNHFWLAGDGSTSAGAITLEQVRQLAAEFKGRELPGFASYRVLETLVAKHKGRWADAAQECLGRVDRELRGLVDRLLHEQLGNFKPAESALRGIIFDLQEAELSKTRGVLELLMEVERELTWTQNDHYYHTATSGFLDRMKEGLYAVPDINLGSEYTSTAVTYLGHIGIQGVTHEHLRKLAALVKMQEAGPSADENLLHLVAATLAYFKVSTKRVIDYVPMHTTLCLLQSTARRLEELPLRLMQSGDGSAPGGGNGGPGIAHLVALMEEDRSVAARRAELAAQRDALTKARKILSA
ncbi:mx [Scenedesmus sp. PABB004]|nr:mx [Scenedesmus sp. PABB004]